MFRVGVRARARAGRGGASMSDRTVDTYEMVVGLEVHVQLRRATKLFCNCSTQFGAPPNRNTCPVCLALPGALAGAERASPSSSRRARRSRSAARCTSESIFARKNYFYPDLPKGYQISQFDQAARDGRPADRSANARTARRSRIGITRVHMEEDAGQVHPRSLPGRNRHRSQSRGCSAHRDRQRARPAVGARGRRVPRTAQADPASTSTSAT